MEEPTSQLPCQLQKTHLTGAVQLGCPIVRILTLQNTPPETQQTYLLAVRTCPFLVHIFTSKHLVEILRFPEVPIDFVLAENSAWKGSGVSTDARNGKPYLFAVTRDGTMWKLELFTEPGQRAKLATSAKTKGVNQEELLADVPAHCKLGRQPGPIGCAPTCVGPLTFSQSGTNIYLQSASAPFIVSPPGLSEGNSGQPTAAILARLPILVGAAASITWPSCASAAESPCLQPQPPHLTPASTTAATLSPALALCLFGAELTSAAQGQLCAIQADMHGIVRYALVPASSCPVTGVAEGLAGPLAGRPDRCGRLMCLDEPVAALLHLPACSSHPDALAVLSASAKCHLVAPALLPAQTVLAEGQHKKAAERPVQLEQRVYQLPAPLLAAAGVAGPHGLVFLSARGQAGYFSPWLLQSGAAPAGHTDPQHTDKQTAPPGLQRVRSFLLPAAQVPCTTPLHLSPCLVALSSSGPPAAGQAQLCALLTAHGQLFVLAFPPAAAPAAPAAAMSAGLPTQSPLWRRAMEHWEQEGRLQGYLRCISELAQQEAELARAGRRFNQHLVAANALLGIAKSQRRGPELGYIKASLRCELLPNSEQAGPHSRQPAWTVRAHLTLRNQAKAALAISARHVLTCLTLSAGPTLPASASRWVGQVSPFPCHGAWAPERALSLQLSLPLPSPAVCLPFHCQLSLLCVFPSPSVSSPAASAQLAASLPAYGVGPAPASPVLLPLLSQTVSLLALMHTPSSVPPSLSVAFATDVAGREGLVWSAAQPSAGSWRWFSSLLLVLARNKQPHGLSAPSSLPEQAAATGQNLLQLERRYVTPVKQGNAASEQTACQFRVVALIPHHHLLPGPVSPSSAADARRFSAEQLEGLARACLAHLCSLPPAQLTANPTHIGCLLAARLCLPAACGRSSHLYLLQLGVIPTPHAIVLALTVRYVCHVSAARTANAAHETHRAQQEDAGSSALPWLRAELLWNLRGLLRDVKLLRNWLGLANSPYPYSSSTSSFPSSRFSSSRAAAAAASLRSLLLEHHFPLSLSLLEQLQMGSHQLQSKLRLLRHTTSEDLQTGLSLPGDAQHIDLRAEILYEMRRLYVLARGGAGGEDFLPDSEQPNLWLWLPPPQHQ